MLARLDTELSPARAEVDHTGTLLRISQEGTVDLALVERAGEVMNELGYSLEPLAPHEAVPETWYRSERVDELSVEEAHILASRLAAEFAAGRSVAAEMQAALEAALRPALFRAMVGARDESAGPEALLAELGQTAGAVLDPALLETFRPWLREKLASFSRP